MYVGLCSCLYALSYTCWYVTHTRWWSTGDNLPALLSLLLQPSPVNLDLHVSLMDLQQLHQLGPRLLRDNHRREARPLRLWPKSLVQFIAIIGVDQKKSAGWRETPQCGENEGDALIRFELVDLDVLVGDLVVCQSQPVQGDGRVTERSPGKVEEPFLFCFSQLHLETCSQMHTLSSAHCLVLLQCCWNVCLCLRRWTWIIASHIVCT